MAKIEYSKKDLRELWGIKRSSFERLLADGILDAPINKDDFEILPNGKKRFRHPRWTPRQVREAERRQDERENPKPKVAFKDDPYKIRPFRKGIKKREVPASFFRQKLTD